MNTLKILDGKTVLVSGGTSGIGFYTAVTLARMGAVTYITGRNVACGREAECQLRAAAGQDNVFFIKADASTVGGNQNLAKRILAETSGLDVLVNNVGGMYNDRWVTADSYEATLAMNFVGPFALTEALLPILQSSTQARIVNVNSAGHLMWKGDLFADVQSREIYNATDTYIRSKYLNLLWTLALARRLEGTGIVANAFHPRTAWMTMMKSSEPRSFPPGLRPFWPVLRLIQRIRSPEKAARASVYLASAPEAAQFNGRFFESSTQPKELPTDAMDVEKQEKAWDLGSSLVHAAQTAIPMELEQVI